MKDVALTFNYKRTSTTIMTNKKTGMTNIAQQKQASLIHVLTISLQADC